jgi:hypothetical protein
VVYCAHSALGSINYSLAFSMKYDLQWFFDNAWTGLKSQGFEKSNNSIGLEVIDPASGFSMCLYHGPNNRRCAIGWSIDPAKYDLSIEGHSVRNVFKDITGRFADQSLANDLAALQGAHDHSKSASDMCERLIEFAREHRLTIPL